MALAELALGSRTFGTRLRASSVMTRLALWRSRRALASLDDHRLADIGVSAQAAFAEAKKGVWNMPATWRKL